MRKNVFKIFLDIGMLILMVLMFNKSVISMEFHEIGGLVLIGAFVVHHIMNGKWITAATKGFFSNKIKPKDRLGNIVNILLLVSFVLIAISGVLISEVVFSFRNADIVWKTVHYFCSALVIILMGVHIGLHMGSIKGIWKKAVPVSNKVTRAGGIICLCVILLFGIYSMVTTSFSRWISMPFTMGTTGQMGAAGNMQSQGGEALPPDSMQVRPEGMPEGSEKGNGQTPQGNAEGGVKPQENFEAGQMPDRGEGSGERSAPGGQFNIDTMFLLIANYISMIVVFAAAVCGIEWLLEKRKSKPEMNEPQ